MKNNKLPNWLIQPEYKKVKQLYKIDKKDEILKKWKEVDTYAEIQENKQAAIDDLIKSKTMQNKTAIQKLCEDGKTTIKLTNEPANKKEKIKEEAKNETINKENN